MDTRDGQDLELAWQAEHDAAAAAEEASIARRAADGDTELGGPVGRLVESGGRAPAHGGTRPRRFVRWPLPREVVRRFRCAACGAAPGEPCQGRRGDRVGHHQARVDNAATQLPKLSPLGARTGAPGG